MSFHCEITKERINTNQFLLHFTNPLHGALNTFFGVVREYNLGKQVVSIEYDAFVPLTRKCFAKLCAEAQTKWGDDMQIILSHRIGHLFVGDISVAIGVSSMHRDESFLASRYIIEELKKRAPIWKKEYYAQGESEWVKGHALCQHN